MGQIKKTLGKVPVGRGTYSATETYYKENTVQMYGMSFRALTDMKGVAPASLNSFGKVTLVNTGKWELISGSVDTYNNAKDMQNLGNKVGTLEERIDNIKPVQIIGDVTNAADEEDLTTDGNLLKLKDRSNINGMGYVILRQNKTFKEQVTQPNTIYEIRYDFDLREETVEIPSNCMLKFEGGKVYNGILEGDNTKILANIVTIFNDIQITGRWIITEAYPEWFGAVGNGVADDTEALQKCLDSFNKTLLTATYLISSVSVTEAKQLINKGIVRIQANSAGIILKSKSYYSGGQISVGIGAKGITLGEDKVTSRRIYCKNVRITGSTDSIAIYCASSNPNYNTFCFIENVSIYGGFGGIIGNIRASRISANVEQCVDNIDIKGDLNHIDIIGQAGNYREDYPAFFNLVGNNNVITACIYDIASKPASQKYTFNLNGRGNSITNNDRTISCSDDSVYEDSIRDRYLNFIFDGIENPYYKLSIMNGSASQDISTINFFSKRRDFIEFEPTSDTEEMMLQFEFGEVRRPIEVSFLSFSNNYNFDRIEIYDEEVLIDKVYRGGALTLSWFPRRSTDYAKTYSNFIVKCFKAKGTYPVRLYIAKLSAEYTGKNYDSSATLYRPNRGEDEAPLTVGRQFFDTTIQKPIWWNGTAWVDANGTQV